MPTQISDRSVASTASSVLVVARSRPLADVVANQLVEPRLDDRAAPLVEARDLVGVDVDADDVVAVGGERRRRDAADISQTEHRNVHRLLG